MPTAGVNRCDVELACLAVEGIKVDVSHNPVQVVLHGRLAAAAAPSGGGAGSHQPEALGSRAAPVASSLLWPLSELRLGAAGASGLRSTLVCRPCRPCCRPRVA